MDSACNYMYMYNGCLKRDPKFLAATNSDSSPCMKQVEVLQSLLVCYPPPFCQVTVAPTMWYHPFIHLGRERHCEHATSRTTTTGLFMVSHELGSLDLKSNALTTWPLYLLEGVTAWLPLWQFLKEECWTSHKNAFYLFLDLLTVFGRLAGCFFLFWFCCCCLIGTLTK